MKREILIVELKSYRGNDTSLEAYPNPLFIVIDKETGKELDNGYRSRKEATKAWPQVKQIANVDNVEEW